MKFLLFTLLFSCSLFKAKESQIKLSQDLNDNMKKLTSSICLNGQGQGRLELEKEYAISYESFLQKEKKIWGIGAQLPFLGEETLFFKIRRRRISGTIIGKLIKSSRSIDERKKSIKAIGLFSKQVNNILEQILKMQAGETSSFCKLGDFDIASSEMEVECDSEIGKILYVLKNDELVIKPLESTSSLRTILKMSAYDRRNFKKIEFSVEKDFFLSSVDLGGITLLSHKCDLY